MRLPQSALGEEKYYSEIEMCLRICLKVFWNILTQIPVIIQFQPRGFYHEISNQALHCRIQTSSTKLLAMNRVTKRRKYFQEIQMSSHGISIPFAPLPKIYEGRSNIC